MDTTEEASPMGRTSIQVSDELADDLHERKQRGDSYEDVIWRLIERAGGEFVAKDDQKSITYGPSSEIEDGYVLTITTDSQDRVDIHFPEDAMYELWTEVQHTPWPDTLDEQDEAGELRHRLVDLAMGADAEMLQNAVDVLDDRSEV
jgi:hypothetical protein